MWLAFPVFTVCFQISVGPLLEHSLSPYFYNNKIEETFGRIYILYIPDWPSLKQDIQVIMFGSGTYDLYLKSEGLVSACKKSLSGSSLLGNPGIQTALVMQWLQYQVLFAIFSYLSSCLDSLNIKGKWCQRIVCPNFGHLALTSSLINAGENSFATLVSELNCFSFRIVIFFCSMPTASTKYVNLEWRS